jgi:hypothetical protein
LLVRKYMGMQRAEDAVSELTVDINDKQKVLEALLHLMKTYPDLTVERDGRVTSLLATKFSSSSANNIADGVDVVHRLEIDWLDYVGEVKVETQFVDVSPYTTVDGYKVYSSPSTFTIGQMVQVGFGIVPDTKWEDEMVEAGIAKAAIRATRDYLRKNPPIDYSTGQDTETP